MSRSSSEVNYPERHENGSERMRRFFNFFGIRSAADERRQSSDD